MGMWIGIIGGILIPLIIYVVNFIRFGQKKRELERVTGVEIQTSWSKHSDALLFSVYPIAIGVQISLLACTKWVHPDFEFATYLFMFIQTVFLGMPYFAVKGLKCGFYLSEFLTSSQLTLWYEDKELRRGTLWSEDADLILGNEIVNGDYIPLIQDAIPLIEDKSRYLSILKSLSERPLSEYEVGVKSTVGERLKAIEDDLNIRWKGLRIAIGQVERPEVLDKRKEESVREFEKMSVLKITTGTAQEKVDPALKELYALTQNEEAPNDIKELALNAIRDIETKLEKEKESEKEEALRLSAQVVIKTSRQYHGLEA